MGKGVDRARPFNGSELKRLKEAGYGFIGRYLTKKANMWKRLTAFEAEKISENGLFIVSIYQDANNHVGCFTSDKGDDQAVSAILNAHEVKQPTGTPIYFAVDYDTGSSKPLAVINHFRAIAERLEGTGYIPGVYGSFNTVNRVRDAVPAVDYGWQTLAWSRGKVIPGVHLHQFKCDTDLPEDRNVRAVDLNTSNGAAGGWKVAQ